MACNLCKEEKKLIKSHIYPEWVYRALYPDGKVDNKNPLRVVSAKHDYVQPSPIGIWDENILCLECDQKIGRMYDEPCKKIILDSEPVLFKSIKDEGNVYTLPDVDPNLLKNFILSLLLRSIWSNRKEYDHIKMEPSLLERLENIVNNGGTSLMQEFSIVATRYTTATGGDAYKKYAQVPYPFNPGDITYWAINLPNGYKFYVKASADESVHALTPFWLRENYPIFVIEHENFEESEEMKMLQKYEDRILKYVSKKI